MYHLVQSWWFGKSSKSSICFLHLLFEDFLRYSMRFEILSEISDLSVCETRDPSLTINLNGGLVSSFKTGQTSQILHYQQYMIFKSKNFVYFFGWYIIFRWQTCKNLQFSVARHRCFVSVAATLWLSYFKQIHFCVRVHYQAFS